MIVAWMLYALLTGAMLGAAAVAVEWACRARRWPTRWAWCAALALTALLTMLAPVRVTLPRVLLTIPATESAPVTAIASSGEASFVAQLAAAMEAARAAATAPWTAAVRALTGSRVAALDAWLLALWTAASLACLTIAIVVARRMRRARDAWPEVGMHGQRVRVAPTFGPAVVGIRDARIVVPRWLLSCAAPAQRLIVAHEREHVHAGDPRVLALGGMVVILMPWHPLAWWMLARLRLAVELDCDRRVLASGVAPADYGALLLDVAGRGAGLPLGFPALGVPALATRTHHLERRLVAMTSPRPRFARARVLLAAAGTLVAMLAACESRLPTSAELEQLDVASTEKRLALASDSTTHYWVDGVQVSANEARATAASNIVSVQVAKRNDGAGGNVIRIETRKGVALMKQPGDTMTMAGAPHAGTMPKSETRFSGIVFVDGVRTSESALKGLAPDRIKTIDVIKGAHAQELYPTEPDAAKGVIRVTTKSATP